MTGFQLTFFSQSGVNCNGKPVAHWLLEIARGMGIRWATAFTGSEGLGANGRFHSSHFFELNDQPIEVTMVVDEDELGKLFAHIETEKIQLFYVKSPVEFGSVGSVNT